MNIELKPVFNQLLLKLQHQHDSFSSLLEIICQTSKGNFFIGGGAVRDVLLEKVKAVKDIDIFLTADGFNKIANFLTSTGTLASNQFGTNRWFPNNTKDFYYDIIKIPNFYNGLWRCRDITDVLNQFDITANSVAFDLVSGEFYNPQNGYSDIKNRILRAIRFDFPEMLVSGEINISRISVLWFRYNYYAAKLNFEIEPITREWIDDNSYRLTDLEKFKKYFFDPQIA